MPVSVKNIQSESRRIADQVEYLRRYVNTLSSGGGGGITDLTGDVTASGAGSVAATITNDAVTYAKMQNVSDTDKLLGRSTAGAGDIEEIACTAAGRAILDDADAAAQRTTLGLGTLATQSGTYSGTSSGTNTGDQTITLTGNVTGSGTGSFAATIANDAVTYAKIQNVSAASKLLGRGAASGSGDVEEITLGTGLSMTGTTLSSSGGGVSGSGSVSYIPAWTGMTFGDPSTELTDTLMSVDTGVLDIPYEVHCGGAMSIPAGYYYQSGNYSGDVLGIIEADEGLGTWTFKSINGTCVIGDGGPVEYNGISNYFSNSITMADVADIELNTTTGTIIATATGQKLAFHNSTPVIQRAGSSQAAVATTAATNTAPYGFTTQAQADAIITLLNEIRAALVEKGLIKGSA